MKHYSFQLSFALVFVLLSCNKKGEEPQPPVPTQLLSAHRWQLVSSVESGPTIGTIDQYASLPPCIKDNLLQFKAPNSYIYDEGPTKCDPTSPQTREGIWTFSNNDTQLSISEGGYTGKYTINELTATSLKLTLPEMQGTVTAVQKNAYIAVP